MTSIDNVGRVLLVDDDASFVTVLQNELERGGFSVESVCGGDDALEATGRVDFDVIVLDLRLGREDGVEVLSRLRENGVSAEVIMMTGHGSIDSAVEAMRKGARDYLTKPCKLSELELHLRKAIEERRLRQENLNLKQYLAGTEAAQPFITSDPRMESFLETLPRVATSDVPVLICGESGTGKELIARKVHALSLLRDQPFVTLNCAVLKSEILESELFGHEKGSFTGAVARKTGLFEIASGGTIFLDEIGEIHESIQAKLLRILQFGELRRVGGTENIHVSVRIIAATNRDLQAAVEAGEFRNDLFFRLNVVPLQLPPLRERPHDVGCLLEFFLRRYERNKEHQIQPDALAVLERYSWPGNVRELENVARRILIFHDREVVDKETILAVLPQAPDSENAAFLSLADMERRHILRVLMRQNNDKRKAAEVLKVSLKTLYNKLHQYGEM